MTVAELAERLEGVRHIAGGFMARCPVHGDKHPSLKVSLAEDGTILLYCHKGCDFKDIVAAIGAQMSDLFPNADDKSVYKPQPKKEEPKIPPLSEAQVKGWCAALRADGDALEYVTKTLRFSIEAVEQYALGLQVDRSGRRWLMYPYRKNGQWTYAKGRSIDGEKSFMREPRGQASHPFGIDALEPGGVTIVVEGERDAVALWTLGIHREIGGESGATILSLPDGAKAKPAEALVDALVSQRLVYLFLDADGTGDTAAEGLGKALGPDKCRRIRLKEHKDAGDALAQLGPEMGQDAILAAFRDIEDRAEDPTGKRAQIRGAVRRFTAAELLEPPPRQEFLLYPYIPAGTVTTLAGPGGASKTTLLTNLAVCRALGIPFFGKQLRTGKTAILTTEDGVHDYQRKLAALRHELAGDFDAERIADSLTILDMSGMPIRLVEADKGNWHPTDIPEHLAEVLKSDAPGTDLVIMETVSRLAGGVETNESLSILVESAQRLCRLANVAVVLVAHVSQEAGRQGYSDAYAARGGSSLGDNGRSTMVLTNLNENNKDRFAPDGDLSPEEMRRVSVLCHAKSNGAPPAEPIMLERHSTPYGAAVLRLFEPRASDPFDAPRRLTDYIAGITGPGGIVTRYSLRDHIGAVRIKKREIDAVVNAALAEGWLEERPRPGAGRSGPMLIPTGKKGPNGT